MEHHNKMDREQFYRELCTVLGREGFTTQPEQDDLLPVEWDGLPLCRITEGGGVRLLAGGCGNGGTGTSL